MMYVRFPLSLRNVEDLLHERGIDICHESIRFWVDRFGPVFAREIRKRRSQAMRQHTQWRWHLDEVFVKINGVQHYPWRAIDHKGEGLEVFVTKKRDKISALKFLKKALKNYGAPREIVTDRLRSYRAAMNQIGNASCQVTGRYLNNLCETSHQPFRRRERAMSRFRRMSSLQKFCCHPRLRSQPLQPSEKCRTPPQIQNLAKCRPHRVARTSRRLSPCPTLAAEDRLALD